MADSIDELLDELEQLIYSVESHLFVESENKELDAAVNTLETMVSELEFYKKEQASGGKGQVKKLISISENKALFEKDMAVCKERNTGDVSEAIHSIKQDDLLEGLVDEPVSDVKRQRYNNAVNKEEVTGQVAIRKTAVVTKHTVEQVDLFQQGTEITAPVINEPLSRKETAPVINEPLSRKETAPVVNEPLSRKETAPVIDEPLSRKETAPVINESISRKETAPVINESLSRKETAPLINELFSRKETAPLIDEPLSSKEAVKGARKAERKVENEVLQVSQQSNTSPSAKEKISHITTAAVSQAEDQLPMYQKLVESKSTSSAVVANATKKISRVADTQGQVEKANAAVVASARDDSPIVRKDLTDSAVNVRKVNEEVQSSGIENIGVIPVETPVSESIKEQPDIMLEPDLAPLDSVRIEQKHDHIAPQEIILQSIGKVVELETPVLASKEHVADIVGESQNVTKREDLLIGIDLGTSRSAVISSRGDQFSFESVVGYAKDVIGRHLLGADYLVGDEVLGKPFLDIKYPLKDGVIRKTGDFEYDAARKLIQYAAERVRQAGSDRICGVVGVPANASLENKVLLTELAREHLDVAMVVSEPFMVAYGLDQLVNCIIVDIGAGTTDLCAMKGYLPEVKDQVCLSRAGNYIDELLMSSIKVSYPGVTLTRKYVRGLKEQYAFVGEPERNLEVTLYKQGKPFSADITDDVRRACESIVPELVEKIGALISGFDVAHQGRAMANIILSGGGAKIVGLDKFIMSALHDYGNVVVNRVHDVVYTGSAGALKLACELPPEYWREFDTSFEYGD